MPRLTLGMNLSERNADVITYARHIASRLDGNPYFPALPVPIVTLQGHIDALEAAEVAVRRGTHGTATLRDAALEVVVGDLEQEKTYVETVVSQRGEDGPAVAASSGFDRKQSRGPRKWSFGAEQGAVSGEVRLYAPRENRSASYQWQRSIDGTQRIDLPDTNVTSAVVAGLSPGTSRSMRPGCNARA
jgi:hypothetical protein